jgi:hypothetical protein
VTAVWIRFRADLRSRWRSWLGLALVAGLAGGLVIATMAGARRTERALDRYFVATHLGDAYIYSWGPGFRESFRESGVYDARIARLPQVAATQRSAQLGIISRSRSGRLLTDVGNESVSYWVRTDGKGMRSIDSAHLLAGRLPNTTRPNEAIAEPGALRALGLHIGDSVVLRRPLRSSYSDLQWKLSRPLAEITIVGEQASVHPGVEDSPRVYLTSAFYEAYKGRALDIWTDELAVRLVHGQADVPAFRANVEAIRTRLGTFFSNPRSEWTPQAQRSLTLLGQALQLLALVGGLAALLLVGQAIFRQAMLESTEDSTLRALGMSRSQLAQLGALRAASIAVVAAGLALGLAFLLSPLAPVGRARELEPDLGFAVDGLVLACGTAVVLGCILAVGVASSWWVAGRGEFRPDERRPDRAARHSGVASALSRAGWPPPVVAGIRMAFIRGGRSSGGRATLVASILAVSVTATALTFAGSLQHLLDTPRLYGQNWDYAASVMRKPAIMRRLEGDPSVSGIAIGAADTIEINGVGVEVLATEDVKGSVPPTVIEGRAPRAPGEVLLATTMLHKLSARIGDVIKLRRGTRTEELRIVGRGPLVSSIASQEPGAAFTFQTLKRIEPEAAPAIVMVQLAPGTDRGKALARLDALTGPNMTAKPAAVGDFGGVRSTPYLIAALFALAAAAALAHTLVTSTRLRRRELAILRTLGFTRRQVLATVAWQATTIASIGLLVGLPLGFAVGRFAWNAFADNLGVVPEVVTPIPLILLIIPATILLANLIALLPGRIAARTQPAVALRAE